MTDAPLIGPVAAPDLHVMTYNIRRRMRGSRPGGPDRWATRRSLVRRILADVWEADLTVIERELTLAATKPGMESLRGLAAELRTRALEEADKVGTGIATI